MWSTTGRATCVPYRRPSNTWAWRWRSVATPDRIASAAALVLPGVGAFGAAMAQLEEQGLVEPILDRIKAGVPFLGVCLGLQLLFEGSEEDPGACGLGHSARRRARAAAHGEGAPHRMEPDRVSARLRLSSRVSPTRSAFYFVHGYAVVPRSPAAVLTMTDYDGVSFVSSIEVDNVTAVQFHPEKSSTLGLRFYRNFARRAGLGVAS